MALSNFTGADLRGVDWFTRHPAYLLGLFPGKAYIYLDYFSDTKGIKDAIWKDALVNAEYFPLSEKNGEPKLEYLINTNRWRNFYFMYSGGATGFSWQTIIALMKFSIEYNLSSLASWEEFDKSYRAVEDEYVQMNKKTMAEFLQAEKEANKKGSNKGKNDDNRSQSSSSMAVVDARRILGVTANATPKEIKAAYRKQAMKWHPDTVSEEDRPKSDEMMKKVNEAFEILSAQQ